MKIIKHRVSERMIEQVLIPGGITDKNVLRVMKKVPREMFVDEALVSQAYANYALPIGYGQTLSQPLTVATMTQALQLNGSEKVLEIGTGSGYQTAILAHLCKRVYSIERLLPLVEKARKALDALGIHNVHIRAGDGTIGWKEKAPFDAIIITAGSPSMPQQLIDQLGQGGRLIIPVGDEKDQELTLVTKDKERIEQTTFGKATFVKLVGTYGWHK